MSKGSSGSKIGAFDVPGAQLVTRDYTAHTLAAERLDGGGVFNHLLAQRFESPDHDGPIAYVSFLASPDDEDATAQFRVQAVAAGEQFLTALGFES